MICELTYAPEYENLIHIQIAYDLSILRFIQKVIF